MAENTTPQRNTTQEGNRPNTYQNRNRFDRNNNNSDGRSNYSRKGSFFRPKRECYFSKNHIDFIDYKNTDLLKRFLGKNGRISSRRITGTKLIHQRRLANAIKRARFMGLLPFVGPIWPQEYYEQQNREYQERKRNAALRAEAAEGNSQNAKTDVESKESSAPTSTDARN